MLDQSIITACSSDACSKDVDQAQGNFGEVFGLARACHGNDCPSREETLKKLRETVKTLRVNQKELPSDEQLDEIWREMLNEIEKQRSAKEE